MNKSTRCYTYEQIDEMTDFIDYCDHLFVLWKNEKIDLGVFEKDFLISHIPEPYYTIQEGKNILYVLNYNPGHGLEIQTRFKINQKNYTSFKEVSSDLSQFYRENLHGNAVSRNVKIRNFAQNLGFDGVMCVETFFLHSCKFNHDRFLRKYKENQLVKKYTNVLADYLKDKPVLRISAIGSNVNADDLLHTDDQWFDFQNKIMNFDPASAAFISIKTKNAKTTSGIFVAPGQKFVSVMMGSNNLPKIDSSCFGEIKKRL